MNAKVVRILRQESVEGFNFIQKRVNKHDYTGRLTKKIEDRKGVMRHAAEAEAGCCYPSYSSNCVDEYPGSVCMEGFAR